MLKAEHTALAHCLAPRAQSGFNVIFVNPMSPAIAAIVGFGLAGDGRPARLRATHFAGGIVGPHDADSRYRCLEPRFTFTQCGLREIGFAHIMPLGKNTHDTAIGG